MITSLPADSGAEIARLVAIAADFRRRRELDPDIIYPAHAECLWQLGNLQVQGGETEAGLLAISDAIALYRGMAEVQPDPYGVQLASLLATQSAMLAEAAHLEEALAVGADAVAMARQAAELLPERAPLMLISALINMAGLRMRAGDTAGTVEKLAQAVAVFHQAGSTDQGLVGSMVEALHHAAMAFSELGRWDEAVEVRRLLAALFKDKAPAGVAQLLILTLQQASVALAADGQVEAALVRALEAAQLARVEAEGSAEPTLRLALAQALGNLAARCHDCGRAQEGLGLALEAVDLFQGAVAADPMHAVPSLILTLECLATILDSLDLTEQAVTVREQRAQLQQTLEIISPRPA